MLLLLHTRIEVRGIRGPRGGRTVFEGTPVILRRFPRMICFSRIFEGTVFDGAPVVLRRSTRTICFPRVFERAIQAARSTSFHRAVAMELARPWSGGNVWTTVVHRSQQSAVAAGGLLMLCLLGCH